MSVMESMPRTSRPVRSSRSVPGRSLLILLFLLVLLIGLGIGFAPLVISRTPLRDSILNQFLQGSVIDGTICTDAARLRWFCPIRYEGVTVVTSSGERILTGGTLTSSKSLLALVADRTADLGDFILSGGSFTVASRQGGTNLEELLGPLFLPSQPDKSKPIQLRFRVEDCQLRLMDSNGNAQPPLPLGVLVTVSSTADIPVTVTATLGSTTIGRISGEFQIGSEIAARIQAKQFPGEQLGPLLQQFLPETQLAGTFTSDLRLRWLPPESSDRSPTWQIQGVYESADLSLKAPWLVGPPLRLNRLHSPLDVTFTGKRLTVTALEISCDIGHLQASGQFTWPESPTDWLMQPGLSVDATLDLAELGNRLPQLLRLHEDIVLNAGQVAIQFKTHAEQDHRPRWEGSLETTTLLGTRNGQPIRWDQPINASFSGRFRSDGWPEFDDLACRSDFIGLAARGSSESFELRANLDLNRLSKHLRDFLDPAFIQGIHLAGTADVSVQAGRNGHGHNHFHGFAELKEFRFHDGQGRQFAEPSLRLVADARGLLNLDTPMRLDQAKVQLQATSDSLIIQLQEPMANLLTLDSGSMSVELQGELGRWRQRLAPWLQLPKQWILAGTGGLRADTVFRPNRIEFKSVHTHWNNFRFHGLGLLVDEPNLVATGALTLDRKTRTVMGQRWQLTSPTLTARNATLRIEPDPTGRFNVHGRAEIDGPLERMIRTAGLVIDDPAAAITGSTRGTVALTLDDSGQIRFDSDLSITSFRVGTATDPAWQEQQLHIKAVGDWLPLPGILQFTACQVSREGFTLDGQGRISDLTGTVQLDLAGHLAYDLAKLEPQLRNSLGRGLKIQGRGRRPFAVSGPLVAVTSPPSVNTSGLKAIKGRQPALPATPLPPPVPSSALPTSALMFERLSGTAAIDWERLETYGFAVGPGELQARLAGGTIALTPIQARFAEGTVRLNPTIRLNRPWYDLILAPGRIVEKARLTPESLNATLGALGYALPALANVAQAEGSLSFDLAQGNRIPLSDPTRTSLQGNLLLHSAKVAPGPLVNEILSLLQTERKSLATAAEQTVPIAIRDGVVYHDNFRMMVENTAVTTRGGVGLDGRLAMQVELQFPPKIAETLFQNNPRIRESLLKQVIQLPVTGTIDKPKLEPGAFRAAIDEIIRNTTRDATRNLLGDLLKKGLGEPKR